MGCGASTVKNPPPEELKAKIVAATSPKKLLAEEVTGKHLESGAAQAHASATSETTAPSNKDVSPAADDDLSRTSTQGSCSGTPLATPKGEKPAQSVDPLPQSVAPLPAPLDVDAIELPCRDPDAVPHWEREALPAPADTSATRRPGSSAGKLVVHKTEKLRNLEAEARKKRLEDPSSTPEEPKRAPRSCLPPAKDRKKAAKADVFQIAEDEEPAVAQ